MKYAMMTYFLRSIIFFYFFCSSLLYACEFLYPVAYTQQEGKTKVYILYQKSISHLELWVWDTETKIASKGLLSSYTPAGFKLLPDNQGFSFIDNGRIKIKKCNKRSPKSIDIYEPIYNINQIEWIDEENFYLSAKKSGEFSIFQMNIDGMIELMLKDPAHDCMYPQKIGQDLFYIERIIKKGVYKRDYLSYKVVRIDYPDMFKAHKNLLQSLQYLDSENDACVLSKNVSDLDKEEIVNFRSCPIAFLKMVSPNEGFFLEHPAEVDRHDRTIPFSCYQIKRIGDDDWECKEIFQFNIPSYLLLNTSDFRIYESILPMLPKFHENKAYFVDCLDEKTLTMDIFCYDLQLGDVEQKTFGKSGQSLFSPIFIGNTVFYGGIMGQDLSAEALAKEDNMPSYMWINEDGDVCIELPTL